jgi:hypothetical protein
VDMIPEKVKAMVNALRNKTKANPDNPKLKPVEQRRRGYQLYAQEAQQMGEPVVSYEEWIAGQE